MRERPLFADRPDLERLISDVRNAVWIAAHLERTFFHGVSREKPGRHQLDVDAMASEVSSWALRQAEEHVERLAAAYFGAEAAKP